MKSAAVKSKTPVIPPRSGICITSGFLLSFVFTAEVAYRAAGSLSILRMDFLLFSCYLKSRERGREPAVTVLLKLSKGERNDYSIR